MDLSTSDRLKALLPVAERFLEEHAYPLEPEVAKRGFAACLPELARARDEVKKLGLFAPQIPKEHGGVGLSFLFLQAVHYSVWLSWIPQEDLPGEGTTTFKMSARSFARDLGRPAAVGVVLLALVVAAAGVVTPHHARHVYLSLATFHGYLELSMLAFLLARGRALAA